MEEKIKIARVILIGCGPHAKRVYLPALRQILEVDLVLVVDLESQESLIREILNEDEFTDLLLIRPFTGAIPIALERRLSAFVKAEQITGVIIATEPLVHHAYADWALENGLNILMDKPISTRANVTSDINNAKGILEDYEQLLDKYQNLQLVKETVFMVNSQRRFHRGFEFVGKLINEMAIRTNCPVTFIQAYHCDGQWRLPNEILTQEYHPYCFGYGKASHSGYHILDTIYQFYKAGKIDGKFADSMDISSAFIQPNGFFDQITRADYKALFGEEYDSVNQWSDEQLKQLCTDFGEIDISSVICLKKDDQPIANFSINLIHNGFAGRTWIQPGLDLYKGNGRIKHESYHIQQGPFQNIQIHAYQGSDQHEWQNGPEYGLGGKNHFEIYVFRNPFFADGQTQPRVYQMKDIIVNEPTESESGITMEQVKFNVVRTFVNYLVGKIVKEKVPSQLEDHLIPVQMLSGIYSSHILKKDDFTNKGDFNFGLTKHEKVN